MRREPKTVSDKKANELLRLMRLLAKQTAADALMLLKERFENKGKLLLGENLTLEDAALYKLALDFCKLPAKTKVRAIAEEWDRDRLMMEVY